jgi:hypothetical protein
MYKADTLVPKVLVLSYLSKFLELQWLLKYLLVLFKHKNTSKFLQSKPLLNSGC